MTSHESPHGEVTVIFRKEASLIIPEFGLPVEERLPGETYEHAMYRLSQKQGVIAHIERFIPADDLEGVPDYAYLGRGQGDELEGSSLLVQKEKVPEHIENHAHLSTGQKKLFLRAIELL